MTAEVQAAHALRSIARKESMKSYVQQSSELYPLLLRAAKRFISGESREEGIAAAQELNAKGYGVSLEYIGENVAEKEECHKAKDELLLLIEELGSLSMKQVVSFDLSHIGLLIHREAAYAHAVELAERAKKYGMTLMISMEESAKTDDILWVYKKIVEKYSHVGITIQAHLHRSVNDMKELLCLPGKIRIVKGAFQEPTDTALPRSEELNTRYLMLVEQAIKANHPISIATHDEELMKEMKRRQYVSHPHVEVEMLYGVRPDLLRDVKNEGHDCRVYITYGTDWYLYLCHRIAEYPENIYRALVDMTQPSAAEGSTFY